MSKMKEEYSDRSPGSGGRKGLYVMMLSIHGLLRSEDPELGRDPDTGGQITYVLELARALGRHRDVERVDLVTRRVVDKKVDPVYEQRYEELNDKARIVRFHFGPRRYLRKETLWPHLDAMVDRIVQFIREQGRLPDVIHGHYADAGYVGSQLSRLLGVPFVFTGHSLGRVKRERLLEKGRTAESIEKQYNITRRIEGEEVALETAALVVTSTGQEQEEQYAKYENFQPRQMYVIPPGVDLSRFSPPGRKKEHPPYRRELRRFLRNPDKPMILAISRADERKNIQTLLEAFAREPKLRRKANLVIVAGNRDRIEKLDKGARKVIWGLLRRVDRHDLYGHVAYPKHHSPDDIPDLYRMASRTKGLFVNPALTEPFGLTLLEAAASGLPIIATRDGGPVDIMKNCRNGKLIDPLDTDGLSETLLDALENTSRWNRWRRNGLKGVHEHYSWDHHVEVYLKRLKRVLRGPRLRNVLLPGKSILPEVDRLLITDIDGTLLGDKEALGKLMERVRACSPKLGFGVATGRRVDSALKVLKRQGVGEPDLLITCVGSEIYYKKQDILDLSWAHHINHRWFPERVVEAMEELPGITLQAESEQRAFKVSYDIKGSDAPSKAKIARHLRERGLRVNVIHSHGSYVDILPQRASKGLAVRFLAYKWGIPLDHILVAGDSGNDAEMLTGDVLGVVVGNYSEELEPLRDLGRIYFADAHHAAGIAQGIAHYQFFDQITTKDDETHG